jgi:uncharacterized protein
MHDALQRTEHRTRPLPNRAWTWRQAWRDLLFAHWPIPTANIRSLVPAALEIDEWEGTSWIGVVPFRMAGVMRRPLPDFPGISAFPELNLRLYVKHGDKPGVWFLSLDAANRLAVWAAKRCFHLPYFHANMSVEMMDNRIQYFSERRNSSPTISFRAEYEPTGEPYESRPGTLEHWLTERYCLYAQNPAGQLYRAEVHHHPWPLQPARAVITHNDLFQPHGLSVSGEPHLLHFAKRIDVVVWDLERVEPDNNLIDTI